MQYDPFWWEQLDRQDYTQQDEWMDAADWVVVGAGYTGLCAALELARNGQSVLVLDAGTPGHGASTRNGGMPTGILKRSLDDLTRSYGIKSARWAVDGMRNATHVVEQLIAREGIDCKFERSGLYIGAHTPRHYDKLAAECQQLEQFGFRTRMVPRSEQSTEIDSDYYHGGRLLLDGAILHPGLYHQGLLRAARRQGAHVVGQSVVTDIRWDGNCFRVSSKGGETLSKQVLVAGNAYSREALSWALSYMLRLRSYVVATEDLGEDTLASLIPKRRAFYDTRRISYYFRPSPDGRRLIFGARPRPWEISNERAAEVIKSQMAELFPALKSVQLTHCWSGYVGYTADKLPISGRREDGVHFCMGYCGQGIAASTWIATEYVKGVLGLESKLGVFLPDHARRVALPLRSDLAASLAIASLQSMDRLGA